MIFNDNNVYFQIDLNMFFNIKQVLIKSGLQTPGYEPLRLIGKPSEKMGHKATDPHPDQNLRAG